MSTPAELNKSVYPCTIVPARYGGTYEHGKWIAFFLDAQNLPYDYAGDDITCEEWWGSAEAQGVGCGDTPQEAYENLRRTKMPLQSIWDRERRQHKLALAEWPSYLSLL